MAVDLPSSTQPWAHGTVVVVNRLHDKTRITIEIDTESDDDQVLFEDGVEIRTRCRPTTEPVTFSMNGKRKK
jgi:hypothetical protein